RAHGLGVAEYDEVLALFNDPGYQAGFYTFVDARSERNYTAGHIPGAYRYYHFESEMPPPEVMDALMAPQNQRVIVYCTGGKCEDSEYTAIQFARVGVDPSKIAVYIGGINEWKEQGAPVEQGPRGSGGTAQ